MKVVLCANKLLEGHLPVTESIKLYYERMYYAAINMYMADLYIDDIDKIIITDQMTEKVKAYQREHGITEEITDDEFGSVFGKVIYDKKTGRQVIFLNAEEAAYLLDDDSLEKICKGDESKKMLYMRRDRIINLVAHELSHVEYNSLVKTKTVFPCDNFFDNYLSGLVIIMFEEYYACRRASEVSKPSQNEYIKESIVDIEFSIEKLVKKYRNNEILPDMFRKLFLERLQMALNEMCYLLGDIYSSIGAEKELTETKLHVVVESFKRTFDDLYIAARSKREVLIPLNLRNEIIKYYKTFNLDIVYDLGGTKNYIE